MLPREGAVADRDPPPLQHVRSRIRYPDQRTAGVGASACAAVRADGRPRRRAAGRPRGAHRNARAPTATPAVRRSGCCVQKHTCCRGDGRAARRATPRGADRPGACLHERDRLDQAPVGDVDGRLALVLQVAAQVGQQVHDLLRHRHRRRRAPPARPAPVVKRQPRGLSCASRAPGAACVAPAVCARRP